jgi:hypothetical protein
VACRPAVELVELPNTLRLLREGVADLSTVGRRLASSTEAIERVNSLYASGLAETTRRLEDASASLRGGLGEVPGAEVTAKVIEGAAEDFNRALAALADLNPLWPGDGDEASSRRRGRGGYGPSMRRAVWTSEALEVSDGEPGPLAPGWVRLRVEACGICGSDLHSGTADVPRPIGTSPGHEFVGTVVDGPAASPTCATPCRPTWVCGACEFCLVGKTNLCGRGGPGIGLGRDGALAETVDAPVGNLAAVAATPIPSWRRSPSRWRVAPGRHPR